MSEKKLNKNQQLAVNHLDGPMLVVAGAGTGKTSVIVERLVKLVEQGIDRKYILALTFTEKAAQEMLDRASERLQESYGVELNLFTFNAFGQALLSEFAIEIGMSSNLKLIGDNGKVVLLREHLDGLGLDYFAPISKPDGQLADIANYFSQLKQQLVKPDEYEAYAQSLPSGNEEEKLEKKRHTELAHAYKTYIQITRQRNIIDYDDQLYMLVELLEQRPNILKQLQDRYRYIMVDEFQDTNPMQSRVIDLLAGKSANVFAVGDDDQSIYGWRGATLANILEFTKRYPQAKEITLIENYRSTQEILDDAWRLIQHNNPNRLESMNNLDKRLQAFRGKGKHTQLHKFSRLDAELHWVAEDIKRRIEVGEQPGSMAVLARSRATLNRVHQMLDAAQITHTVAGMSNNLYKHPAIATMLEALRTVAQPGNSSALFHTLSSSLFGCDSHVLSQAAAQARSQHEPLESILAQSGDTHIVQALELINQWRILAADTYVRTVSYRIVTDSGLKDRLYAEAEESLESMQTVQAIGQWFGTLNDFEQVSSLPSVHSYLDNIEVLQAEGETIADDTVNITTDLPVVMTAHKAKGLEWPTVYIVDCTERSFPLQKFGTSLNVPAELAKTSSADDHMAEERRLMYVAATRAKDQLIITHSESHNGITKRKPSRFIQEMLQTDGGKLSSAESLVGLELLQNVNHITQPIPLPASMRQNGNIVLTASQADDYMRCPLNFYYRHVLNVPEAPTAVTGVGSLFHAVIQDLNTAKLQNKAIPKLDVIIDKFNREWPIAGYGSKSQRERALKQGLNSVKQLYERIQNEPVPVAVEAPFKVRIPGSKLILKGRIDAVMSATDGIEIRDYKTSTSVNTPEKAKNRTTASNQLVMYAVAWRLLHDETPVQVALDFVQTGQIGTVKKRPATLDGMEAKLAEIADRIQTNDFAPGQKHDMCIHPL